MYHRQKKKKKKKKKFRVLDATRQVEWLEKCDFAQKGIESWILGWYTVFAPFIRESSSSETRILLWDRLKSSYNGSPDYEAADDDDSPDDGAVIHDVSQDVDDDYEMPDLMEQIKNEEALSMNQPLQDLRVLGVVSYSHKPDRIGQEAYPKNI